MVNQEKDIITSARDICRARQIACVALAHSNAEYSKESLENAFVLYKDAADAISKILEIT